MTFWKKDMRKVMSHSLAFSAPHSMEYRMVKKPDPAMLRKHTEDANVGKRLAESCELLMKYSFRLWTLRMYADTGSRTRARRERERELSLIHI